MNIYPQFLYYIFINTKTNKQKSLHTEFLQSGILVIDIMMLLISILY